MHGVLVKYSSLDFDVAKGFIVQLCKKYDTTFAFYQHVQAMVIVSTYITFF